MTATIMGGEVDPLVGRATAPADAAPAPDGTEFTLLGPVQVLDGSRDVAPTASRPRQVLAMLLTRAGRLVPTDSLIEELWAQDPPPSARTTLQTYVYQLRRCFAENGITVDGEAPLCTRPAGYVLDVDPVRVDAVRFTALVDEARARAEGGDADGAARLARSSLALWWGAPMSDVAQGPWLSSFAIHQLEQRRAAHELYLDCAMRSGRHGAVIGELRSLAAANPLDEGVQARLIHALGSVGRRDEALRTYRRLTTVLREELGVEPGREAARLHQELIATDRR